MEGGRSRIARRFGSLVSRPSLSPQLVLERNAWSKPKKSPAIETGRPARRLKDQFREAGHFVVKPTAETCRFALLPWKAAGSRDLSLGQCLPAVVQRNLLAQLKKGTLLFRNLSDQVVHLD